MSSLELARLLIARLNAGKLSHDDLLAAGPEARKLMLQMINLGHGKGLSSDRKQEFRVSMREMVAHA